VWLFIVRGGVRVEAQLLALKFGPRITLRYEGGHVSACNDFPITVGGAGVERGAGRTARQGLWESAHAPCQSVATPCGNKPRGVAAYGCGCCCCGGFVWVLQLDGPYIHFNWFFRWVGR
jgi:hypothetical protein